MELNSDPAPRETALDVDSVDTEAWSPRRFPIQGSGQRNLVQVVFHRSALDALQEHGRSRTDVEVCGVLVGGCYRDERGPYIYVETVIRGKYAENQLAQVTFTARTWSHIQSELEQHHAGKLILGWYHTHPGFGIFLSAMDLFIHENFFNSSEQLALVYDPIAKEDGLFVWHAGQATRHSYLVVEEGGARPEKESGSQDGLSREAKAGSGFQDFPERLRRLEQRQFRLFMGLMVISVVAVAWPLLASWWGLSTVPWKRTSKPESSPRQATEARSENFHKRPVRKRSDEEERSHLSPPVQIEELDALPFPVNPPGQREVDQVPVSDDLEPMLRMDNADQTPRRPAPPEFELDGGDAPADEPQEPSVTDRQN